MLNSHESLNRNFNNFGSRCRRRPETINYIINVPCLRRNRVKVCPLSSQYCDSSLLYSPIEIGCYSVHLGGDQEQCGTKTVSCLDFKLHSRFFVRNLMP